MTTTKTLATAQLATHTPEAHPFVKAMREGTLTNAQAKAAALEIRHVVAAFPRFLAALIAQIPDHPERMDPGFKRRGARWQAGKPAPRG